MPLKFCQAGHLIFEGNQWRMCRDFSRGDSLLGSFVKGAAAKLVQHPWLTQLTDGSRFNQRRFLSYPSPLAGEGKGEGEEG